MIKVYADVVSNYVGATEAARRLGVQKATLYAYVSRGLVARRLAADGRTSLYDVSDLETLAGRSRRAPAEPPPSIDVQIVSAVSTLDEEGVRYRGHDVAELARTRSFEDVSELLWTGELPAHAARWPEPSLADRRLSRRVSAIVGAVPLAAMAGLATALAVRHADDPAPDAARRLLALTPVLLGAGEADRGPMAERVAAVWAGANVHCELTSAIDRSLVLLADHELATSTLAVRVAASTRTGPYPAFAAGLAVLQGALHGDAAVLVHELLVECEEYGAATAVDRRLRARERLPGFGHRIYRGEDPRLRPLLEAVAPLPDPNGRRDVVDDLLIEAGIRLTRQANVDLGLGALTFVAGLPADAPLFAIARLAGFAAHFDEELAERPLRYRGLARSAT